MFPVVSAHIPAALRMPSGHATGGGSGISISHQGMQPAHKLDPPFLSVLHPFLQLHTLHFQSQWLKLQSAVPPVSAASRTRSLLCQSRTVLIIPGGIGQPLSLLLKLNPLITELSLYDVVNAIGVSLAIIISAILYPREVLISRSRPIFRTSRLPPRSPVSCPPITVPRRPSRDPTSSSSPLVCPGSPA
jgi:hypothetical protein